MARFKLSFLLALGVVGVAAPSSADDPAECRPEVAELDRYQYLRALSLDLRGVVPSMEEYQALDALEDVSAETLTQFLQSQGLAERVARQHRSQLWPAISNVRLVYFRRRLVRNRDTDLWWRTGAADSLRRGGSGCLDQPATFDPEGNIIFQENPDGSRQEGYVMRTPYWDPSISIKVCALDGQEQALSTVSGRACNTRATTTDEGCGCGPNLRWCDTTTVHNAITSSMTEDIERRIHAMALDGDPYHTLFTGRRAFVNGPLVFFWKNLTYVYDRVPLVPAGVDVAMLPDLDYTDTDTWMEIELPEAHAGLLTSPLFLLRFQTNRSRASRFFDAFLCRPFQPPPGGIPLDDEVAALQPDVQRRPGCNYCHAILEPSAAHWGRWTQQGGGFLDPVDFPAFDPSCADCGRGLEACSESCNLHYITRAISPEEEEYLGMLRGFQFLRREHEGFVDDGPGRLVREGLVDGSFTECTSKRAVEWLIGRSPAEQELDWMDGLTTEFVGSELQYTELVRQIVTSATYRRVR